jgi:hypothetical protein
MKRKSIVVICAAVGFAAMQVQISSLRALVLSQQGAIVELAELAHDQHQIVMGLMEREMTSTAWTGIASDYAACLKALVVCDRDGGGQN